MTTAAMSPAVAQVHAAILGMGGSDIDGGVRLPPERELAIVLKVSRSTLRAALNQLEAEGLLTRLRGRSGGTFLGGGSTAPRKMERRPGQAVSVPELLREQGFTVGTRVLQAGIATMPTDASIGFPDLLQGAATLIERLRFADGVSLSWEKAYIPTARFPDLLEHPLSGSLYDLLDVAYNVRPHRSDERIEVLPATREAAALLEIPTGRPLIAVRRWTRDVEGGPVEFSYDLFRADRTTLTVRSTHEADQVGGLQIVAP